MMEDEDQSTVLQSVVELSPKPDAVFDVVVIEGPDAGARVRLDGTQEVLVGQSPVCTLRLTDEMISRRHLALEVVGAELRIRDLGSRNGTAVSGLRVLEAFLAGGEVVTIGASRIRIDREAGAKPARVAVETRFGPLLGISREMRRLYPVLERLASSDVPVLIEGDTGTGKEVVARALHDRGARASGPFVVFDCTAVSPSLVESELFGHERGAFTGATTQRRGVFEQAHRGTLFIDEIGDMPLDMQPKLLRALERSEVRRVGGERWLKCDVRVIAATRRDVDRLVQGESFRDDLFHRLAVGRVELPPLRRRKGDVAILAEYFCKELGGDPRTLPTNVVVEWQRRDWPGNVRELRNAVARELALGDLSRTLVSHPAEAVSESLIDEVLAEKLAFPDARQRVLDAFQRRYLQYMLDAHEGSVQKAAEASGIALRYFQLLRARAK